MRKAWIWRIKSEHCPPRLYQLYQGKLPEHRRRYTTDNHKRPLKGTNNRKRALLQTEIDGFLYHIVSSWIKEGTKLERLRILTVKKAPSFGAWKVPSMTEKGTKLYGKRMIILIKVLIRLLDKTSMDELMTYMEYRNRKSFIDTYIKPLMEYDLIQRTYPNNPRHPNQKYLTTEKGRRFLGGFEL